MKPTIDLRLAALRRFAVAITALNVLGHGLLGFEQSYAQVVAALVTAYGLELLLEWTESRAQNRPPRFGGGWVNVVDFLLPGHITALACAMLLYANEAIGPMVFAVAVAVGSKHLLKAPLGRGSRHFLNPSNAGIAVTLILFPWVGIAPPYMFTENIAGVWDWLLPVVFIVLGTFLNARFTRKIPLILAWVGGFFLQALIRAWLFDTPLTAALNPMLGVAFLLFTFYMVTDPATTPFKPAAQVLFGASVAAFYGLLVTLHVVFGFFFALFMVCSLRGAWLYLLHWREARQTGAAHGPLGGLAIRRGRP